MAIIIVQTEFSEDFEKRYRKYMKFIPSERASGIERIKSEKDKVRSLLAGLVIRNCITEETGLPAEKIVFEYGEHGKPMLQGNSVYYFSVSHAGNYVAFVSNTTSVGIDIESRKRGNEKIAKRFFTENEYCQIYTEKKYDFTEVWTLKEAYVKMTGKGLSQGFNTFDVLDGTSGAFFNTYNIPDGYAVSVCSDEPIEKSDIIMMSEQELFDKFNQ